MRGEGEGGGKGGHGRVGGHTNTCQDSVFSTSFDLLC